MKKIIVLIAILSLAACAGGTGGGSVSVNPDDGTITITPNQPDNGNNTGDDENPGSDNNQNDDNETPSDNNNPNDNPDQNSGDSDNNNNDDSTSTDNGNSNIDINLPDESVFQNVSYRLLGGKDENMLVSFIVNDNRIDGMRMVENESGDLINFVRNDENAPYAYTAQGYSYVVERTFPIYHTVLSEDPRSSDVALQALRNQRDQDIAAHNCFDDCIRETENMLANDSYVVEQLGENSYSITFFVHDYWTKNFLDKDYVEANLMNSTKAQQVEYLLERHYITEERAREILNDSSIGEGMVIPGICGTMETQSDCQSTLESIAADRGEFAPATVDISFNSNQNANLSYSTFGTAQIKLNSFGNPEEVYQIFYGGDRTKLKNKENIETNMIFNGIASGEIGHTVFDEHGHEVDDEWKDLNDNNAQLVFSPNSGNPTETLTASFANDGWYDVQVVRNNNTDTITFTDNTNGQIGENWKFIGDKFNSNNVPNDAKPESNVYAVQDFTTETRVDPIRGVHREGSFETQYYGENIPSEVVGGLYYEEANGDPIHETGAMEFSLGFGMRKTEN